MNRTDRLYAITEELRVAGAGGCTASWLAQRFEISVRTVKRDVSALQQAGVPIWSQGGPGGGYILDAAATLPPLTFTVAEAIAVAVALAMEPARPFAPEGRSALTKVVGTMFPTARAEVERLAGRVWVRRDRDPAASRDHDGVDGRDGVDHGRAEGRPALAGVIDDGLRNNRVVVLDYLDATGTVTRKRPVEPLALGHSHGHWYLFAWCRHRRAGRSFRLDRVRGAWLTTEHFEPRDVEEAVGPAPSDAEQVRL